MFSEPCAYLPQISLRVSIVESAPFQLWNCQSVISTSSLSRFNQSYTDRWQEVEVKHHICGNGEPCPWPSFRLYSQSWPGRFGFYRSLYIESKRCFVSCVSVAKLVKNNCGGCSIPSLGLLASEWCSDVGCYRVLTNVRMTRGRTWGWNAALVCENRENRLP